MLMYPLIVCELNGEFIKKEKFAKRKIKEKLPKRFFFEKLSYIYTKKKRKKDDFYLTFSMVFISFLKLKFKGNKSH